MLPLAAPLPKGKYRFWNNYNSVDFTLEDSLIQSIAINSFSGRNFTALNELEYGYEISFSIQDYDSNNDKSFLKLEAEITTIALATFVKKVPTEQIAIIDLQTYNTVSIHAFDFANGLIQIADSAHLANVRKRNENVSSKLSIDDTLLTDRLIASLNEIIGAANTAWLITGEVASYSIPELIEQLIPIFNHSKFKSPLLSEFWVDRYSFLNYSSLFSAEFWPLNFSVLFERLPLTIVNSNLLPGAGQLPLLSADGHVARLLPLKNHSLVVDLDQLNISPRLPSVKLRPGKLWLWTKADRKRPLPDLMPVSAGAANQSQANISSVPAVNSLHSNLDLSRKSAWTIRLPAKVAESQESNQPFKSNQGDLLQSAKEEVLFDLGKPLTKDKLAIVAGQRVTQGQLLFSEKAALGMKERVLEAPVTGVVSTQYLSKGFLGFKPEKTRPRDLRWLNDADEATVLRKLTNTEVEIELQSHSLPLLRAAGKDWQGTLRIWRNQEDLDSLARELAGDLPNAVVICEVQPSAKQVLDLYHKGARVVITPQFSESDRIPQRFLAFFGWGEVHGESSALTGALRGGHCGYDPRVWSRVKDLEGEPVFFSSQSFELKFLAEPAGEHTFAMDSPADNPFSQKSVQKGDRVLCHVEPYYLNSGVVLGFEDGELLVRLDADHKIIQITEKSVTISR